MTPCPASKHRLLALMAAVLPLAGLGLGTPAAAQTVPQGGAPVVISQVFGGGGNSGAALRHDFIELFNRSSAAVALGGWSVQYASATGGSWQVTPLPAGTLLSAGRYLLVRQSAGAGGSVDVLGDVIGSIQMAGGSGKVALASHSTAFSGTVPTGAIDFVGYGTAGTAEGSPTGVLSSTTSAQRAAGGCTDTDNNATDFSVAGPAPRNSTSTANLCSNVPANQPITPSCPAASVALGAAAVLSTSASDPDSLVTSAAPTAAWPAGFSLGSFTAANAAGGTATQTLQVAAGTPAGGYTLGLQWANNDAQTATCSFTVTVAGITPIPAIQGTGATSPLVGQTVLTTGVVTKVTNNGFFLQDPDGDGRASTSDGILVFTSSAPTVSVGQRLRLSGVVTEFNTGATDSSARTVTELTNPTSITVLGTGSVLPTPLTLPVAAAGDLERHEGMLVTVSGPLTVAQNFFQGRYGQITLAAGGRLETPTNRFRPGPQAAALADANARSTLLLDDGSSVQNPNPIPYLASGARAGDTTGAITGVIDYGLATNNNPGLGLYKIHPVAAPVFSSGNPRTAAPAPVGGNLKVASFNVLNYFTAYINGGGTANGCSLGGTTSTANCRGANNATEFGRQQAKIVEAMAAIDADVLGLMEIQNNGNTAVQSLVTALNARLGAGTYATTSLPADTGDDAIRVAIVYKPGRLSPVGAAVSDNQPINNRPTLAQTFSLPNGERFTLAVNHLKSKGSCPAPSDADYTGNFDSGDGQGCWNLLRTQQAQRLRAFVAERLAATASSDALLIGDLNAYAQEDPIIELVSGGFADQVQRFEPGGYSYVFDGAAGRLDHALANTTLAAKVNRVTHWHINADEPAVTDYNTEFKAPEVRCGAGGAALCPPDPYAATPYRSSDHDPVVVGLNLYNRVWTGTGRADVITGGAGDDLLLASAGADLLTGGAGSNGFAFRSLREAGGSITDFVPGKDRIDLSALLASIRAPSDGLVQRGIVRLVAAGAHTLLQIDTDGTAGPSQPRTLVTLRNVQPAAVQPLRDLGLN